MSLFENFPYTNFHELNLDWIIKRIKELQDVKVESVNGKQGTVVLTGEDIPVDSNTGTKINTAIDALATLVGTFDTRITNKAEKRPTKVVTYGDSIMYGLLGDFTQSYYNWPEEMGRILDIDVTNRALSGQSMSNYDTTSFINMVDNIDIDDFDIIILGFGFNDVGHGVAITGTDNNGFGYAYRNAIKKIQQKNQKIQIVLCTTTYSSGLSWRYLPSNINADDANNEILKIANEFNLSVLDFVHNAGVNSENVSALTWDGLHFTNDGYKKLANYAASALYQNHPNINPDNFIVQSVNSTTVDSGTEFRMYYNSKYPPKLIKMLSFIQGKPGFNLSLIKNQATQIGLELKPDGNIVLTSGAVNLHPDEVSAVAMSLSAVNDSYIAGNLYYYGDTGTITMFVWY